MPTCDRPRATEALEDASAWAIVINPLVVLKLDRIVETADGEPVEWRVMFRKV